MEENSTTPTKMTDENFYEFLYEYTIPEYFKECKFGDVLENLSGYEMTLPELINEVHEKYEIAYGDAYESATTAFFESLDRFYLSGEIANYGFPDCVNSDDIACMIKDQIIENLKNNLIKHLSKEDQECWSC